MRLLLGLAALLVPCIASSQIKFPSAELLLNQAESAHKAHHYQRSAVLYAQALPLLPDVERAGIEYKMACSQALAGDRGESLTTLETAVQDGYLDIINTAADKDLLTLHDDPRWSVLMARMTALKNEQDLQWGNKTLATPYGTNLSPEDKVAGLSVLWAQAKYGFANFWHVPQLDWDQTYRDFIPQVLDTSSTLAYYKVLQRFYAQLQDGHSNVYIPQELDEKTARLPLRTRLIDGHLLVIGSRDPRADLQGLKAGDEVLSINGTAAVAWAESTVGPFISASSPQDRATRTYEYMPFTGEIGTIFRIEAADPAGEKTEHNFTVDDNKVLSKAPFAFRMLPGSIAYVALNEFEDDTDAIEWDKHWAEISKAQGLIVDIRENGGGSTSVGSHVLATLIDKPALGALLRSTSWVATYRAWGKPQTPIRLPSNVIQVDKARRYGGKVVLLTSPRTFSAGEDMAVAFKQSKRGIIVGEPTGGSTGQPLAFALPGGGKARICSKHDSFTDGTDSSA